MPVERISKGFKDISMSFQANPLSRDLIALKNENAIARSLKNIVFTLPGEKFFEPDFGSKISGSLFENIDDITGGIVEDEIRESINTWEPRVKLIDVDATPAPDNNAYECTITYEVIGADVLPQQLEFVLQPTR